MCSIENERLSSAYYNALGKKSVVQSAVLLGGFFPNDGGFRTEYSENIVGLLLDNLNMGDSRKKPVLGSPRYDLWFTFIRKKQSESLLDARYDNTFFTFNLS